MEKKNIKSKTTKKVTKKVVKKATPKEQTTKKKKKGFTLIELLAVIIILGILMIIAIPAVTRYINDSRKSTYIDTAKEVIGATRNKVNDKVLKMFDTNATYYIPIDYIKTENELKSPYGKFVEAYVVVIYDGEGYKYYWISIDETGTGVDKITPYDKLDEDDIKSDLKVKDIQDIVNTTGIGDREKILILNPETEEWREVVGGATNHVSEEEGGGLSNEDNDDSNYLCKRAKSSTLHQVECTYYSSACAASGYQATGSHATSTIVYGNQSVTNGVLTAGDAFDCDVNSDGVFDPVTERFYYVSDYYDITLEGSPSFDTSKATLIYYKNISTTNIVYDNIHTYGSGDSMVTDTIYGPVTAYDQLPSISEWNNEKISLPGSRRIRNDYGGYRINVASTWKDTEVFTYPNKAARFLTLQELIAGCPTKTSLHSGVNGELDGCVYLLENTNFDANGTDYWLETVPSDSYYSLWIIQDTYRSVAISGAHPVYSTRGVRPVITTDKTNIAY